VVAEEMDKRKTPNKVSQTRRRKIESMLVMQDAPLPNLVALETVPSLFVVGENALIGNVTSMIQTVSRIMKLAHENRNAALNFVIRKVLRRESVRARPRRAYPMVKIVPLPTNAATRSARQVVQRVQRVVQRVEIVVQRVQRKYVYLIKTSVVVLKNLVAMERNVAMQRITARWDLVVRAHATPIMKIVLEIKTAQANQTMMTKTKLPKTISVPHRSAK